MAARPARRRGRYSEPARASCRHDSRLAIMSPPIAGIDDATPPQHRGVYPVTTPRDMAELRECEQRNRLATECELALRRCLLDRFLHMSWTLVCSRVLVGTVDRWNYPGTRLPMDFMKNITRGHCRSNAIVPG